MRCPWMKDGGQQGGELRQVRAQAREFPKSYIIHRRHFAVSRPFVTTPDYSFITQPPPQLRIPAPQTRKLFNRPSSIVHRRRQALPPLCNCVQSRLYEYVFAFALQFPQFRCALFENRKLQITNGLCCMMCRQPPLGVPFLGTDMTWPTSVPRKCISWTGSMIMAGVGDFWANP